MTTTHVDTDETLETALVSAFLWAKTRDRNEAARIAEPRHFQHGRNRTLWEHAVALHRNGEPVDSVTLLDSLERAGHTDAAGGVVRVAADIGGVAPVGSDVTDYARRVAARARRRHAITAARDLAATLEGPDIDVDAAIHAGAAEILHAGRTPDSATVPADAIRADVARLRRDGPDPGWHCGWNDIDRFYRPTYGQLSVVTGIPAAGKTTWLNAYLARLAGRHGHRYLLFSPEQASIAKHADALARVRAGSLLSDEVHATAMDWVIDHFAWVDHGHAYALDDIASTARLEADRGRLDGVVVDPWNWLETNRPHWMTETDHINNALNELIRLAQALRVHVWVVAHPRKVRQHETGPKEGQYLVVRPYDIAASAAWFNKPWFCVSLWRDHLAPSIREGAYDPDRDPSIVNVYVQKVRDDDQGAIGMARLRLDAPTKRFQELTDRRPL